RRPERWPRAMQGIVDGRAFERARRRHETASGAEGECGSRTKPNRSYAHRSKLLLIFLHVPVSCLSSPVAGETAPPKRSKNTASHATSRNLVYRTIGPQRSLSCCPVT